MGLEFALGLPSSTSTSTSTSTPTSTSTSTSAPTSASTSSRERPTLARDGTRPTVNRPGEWMFPSSPLGQPPASKEQDGSRLWASRDVSCLHPNGADASECQRASTPIVRRSLPLAGPTHKHGLARSLRACFQHGGQISRTKLAPSHSTGRPTRTKRRFIRAGFSQVIGRSSADAA